MAFGKAAAKPLAKAPDKKALDKGKVKTSPREKTLDEMSADEMAEAMGIAQLPPPMDDDVHTFMLSLSTRDAEIHPYQRKLTIKDREVTKTEYYLNLVAEVNDPADDAHGKMLFVIAGTNSTADPDESADAEGKRKFVAGDVAIILKRLGVDDPKILKYSNAAVEELQRILKEKGPLPIKAATRWEAQFIYDENLDDETKKARKKPYKKRQKSFDINPNDPEKRLPLYVVPDSEPNEELRGLPLKTVAVIVKWLPLEEAE